VASTACTVLDRVVVATGVPESANRSPWGFVADPVI
jgi:hypothetical protein